MNIVGVRERCVSTVLSCARSLSLSLSLSLPPSLPLDADDEIPMTSCCTAGLVAQHAQTFGTATSKNPEIRHQYCKRACHAVDRTNSRAISLLCSYPDPFNHAEICCPIYLRCCIGQGWSEPWWWRGDSIGQPCCCHRIPVITMRRRTVRTSA